MIKKNRLLFHIENESFLILFEDKKYLILQKLRTLLITWYVYLEEILD